MGPGSVWVSFHRATPGECSSVKTSAGTDRAWTISRFILTGPLSCLTTATYCKDWKQNYNAKMQKNPPQTSFKWSWLKTLAAAILVQNKDSLNVVLKGQISARTEKKNPKFTFAILWLSNIEWGFVTEINKQHISKRVQDKMLPGGTFGPEELHSIFIISCLSDLKNILSKQRENEH